MTKKDMMSALPEQQQLAAVQQNSDAIRNVARYRHLRQALKLPYGAKLTDNMPIMHIPDSIANLSHRCKLHSLAWSMQTLNSIAILLHRCKLHSLAWSMQTLLTEIEALYCKADAIWAIRAVHPKQHILFDKLTNEEWICYAGQDWRGITDTQRRVVFNKLRDEKWDTYGW